MKTLKDSTTRPLLYPVETSPLGVQKNEGERRGISPKITNGYSPLNCGTKKKWYKEIDRNFKDLRTEEGRKIKVKTDEG